MVDADAIPVGERFSDIAENQPELLAHHYTESGFHEQAVTYWQLAGEQAKQRSAHAESIAHLTKGLEGLQELPDTPERTSRDLTLHLALVEALQVLKGYGVPEVVQVYARVRALSRAMSPGFVPGAPIEISKSNVPPGVSKG